MIYSRKLLLLCIAVLGLVTLCNARAGRININLTDTTTTGTGLDGDLAILGGGTWNRINHAQASLDNALVDSNANALVGITAKDSAGPFGAPQINGNPIQNEAWGTPDLTISGLIANQVYRVAIYSDREGTESLMDTYTVNLNNNTLPNPGAAVTALPGVEGVDYLIFVVNSSGIGTIEIEAPWIAGIQIEGVLPGEAGPQPDLRISDSDSKAGKGDGIYASKALKSQTLTQETKKKRPRRFYVRVENDGDEIDRFFLTGYWPKKKAKVKVISLNGDGNVTAQTFARNYRYQLSENENRQFKIVVKPKKKKPGNLKARFGASPSTHSGNRQDLVVTETKVPR